VRMNEVLCVLLYGAFCVTAFSSAVVYEVVIAVFCQQQEKKPFIIISGLYVLLVLFSFFSY